MWDFIKAAVDDFVTAAGFVLAVYYGTKAATSGDQWSLLWGTFWGAMVVQNIRLHRASR